MSSVLTPSEETHAPASSTLEQNYNVLRTSWRRASLFPLYAGQLGLANTVRFTIDKHLRHGQESEITVQRPKLFRHPVELTTSPIDVGTLLEISHQRVYQLPASLAERVAGRQIVDVGAHIGLSAVYFASRFPESSVLAIEPHLRNYNYLEQNAQPYQGQIVTVNSAIAAHEGYVDHQLTPDGGPSNHVGHVYAGEVAQVEDAPGLTKSITPAEIGDSFNGRIGLLKIDIEGAEKDLFESDAMASLLKNTNVLAIEAHDNYQPGTSAVVHAGALTVGMTLYSDSGHTKLYAQSRKV